METFENVFTLNMSVSMPKSDLNGEMMKQLRKISQTLDWQDITQNLIFASVNASICQSSNGVRTQLFESDFELGEEILED